MDRNRKRELRELNSRAWDGEKDIYQVNKSLDSSLKKNTAFIKRLRTAISAATLATFLQEIRTLSLHKYLSEIISACYEGLCRLKSPGEIEAGVEIVSALHQRFGPVEFTEYLGWLVGKGLATPEKSLLKTLAADVREKEEKERITRQRVLLRVVTELWLVGVLRTLDDVSRPDDVSRGKEPLLASSVKAPDAKSKTNGVAKGGGAEPFPLEVLKDLLGHDREHANLPLLVIFVKAFGWDILGVKEAGSEGRKTVEEDGATIITEGAVEEDADDGSPVEMAPPSNLVEDPPLASPELQERFRNILNRYFEDVKAHLIRDQKGISKQARKDAEAYVKSGQVFEDRQASYEKAVKAHERLVSNAQVLADAIGGEMPNLKDSEDSSVTGNGGIGLVKTGEYLRGEGDGAGIWEDEDERRFYENLVDLKGKVPGMLLEDGKKKKADGDDKVGKKADTAESTTTEAGVSTPKTTEDDQSTSIANRTIGAQVDALLARLPELTNKELIDQAAIDFCFVNSKASRNRLIKAVQEIPKGRSDLLPSYSRLVATLGKYMPDIPKGLVDHLDQEFRSLQRRKEKEFLGQARLGNIRYLAELTKFGVVPEHVIFHCLKVSLDDFSRMNIEIICNLLENCGRYLLRNPETSPRMTSFLETLKRKKSVQHIGQQERMLIENAVYYVDPPVRAAIQQKERTPIDLFIRKLIYLDMNNRNYTKILKQIRRLHWEESEVVAILEKIFSKPGKVKYGNIHLLAILVSALYRYHQDFVTAIIDNLVEYIALGLESNDFKFNQRRLAEVKYLGELYNYRMVDHPVIFDTMYRIMTFGHGGPPIPGRINPFDMPDDFFRIRLVATLLETCGIFFNRGAAGKKLDYFLSFFQYYIYTKDTLPMDIEFIVQDVFSLTRPQWKLASNLEEASRAFQLAMAQDQKTAGLDKTIEPDEVDSDGSSDDGIGDGEAEAGIEAEAEAGAEAEEDSESDEEADTDGNGDTAPSPQATDSEDEAIVVTRQEEEVDPEAEAEFEREYAKMMAESLESRKHERKSTFDVPLPIRRKDRDATGSNETWNDSPVAPDTQAGGTMAFSLLTKRGNRQQTRTVALPSDSTFAVAMKTQQAAEREEQQRIKNLVLNYDLREGEDQDGEQPMAPLFPNPNIHNTKAGLDKAAATNYSRPDKSSSNRSSQRARKLQLSDVDWYGPKNNSSRFPDSTPSMQRGGSTRKLGSVTTTTGRDLPSGPKSLKGTENQLDARPPKATAPVGRLSRKAILEAHASLKSASAEAEK
ncbi:ARM repeat-containing protein [Venustampulla echinocandica]|uniref:ARM repeat-containing protein n=1 Tax=Venustampulla echinocandica TaxID=2656787 RepID=A0A370TFF8_9HELO|nr:ARM repeat-containing protein [Venustampulla echinocandica]RDL33632.1 ARM repeat-containing protein [Venustampulla echinocandica]